MKFIHSCCVFSCHWSLAVISAWYVSVMSIMLVLINSNGYAIFLTFIELSVLYCPCRHILLLDSLTWNVSHKEMEISRINR